MLSSWVFDESIIAHVSCIQPRNVPDWHKTLCEISICHPHTDSELQRSQGGCLHLFQLVSVLGYANQFVDVAAAYLKG